MTMCEQHVTKIDEDLDPDTPTGHRYQVVCSCRWRGVPTYDRKCALKEADMHRMCEGVKDL